MSEHSIPVKTLLQNGLSAIFDKVHVLQTLNTHLHQVLDNKFKQSCQVANFNGPELVLLVANGTTATELRFMMPDLLRKFKQDEVLQMFQRVLIKVRP